MAAGRGWAMPAHPIILDPTNPLRIIIAISAAGAFRTDDGGATWKPINRGLYSKYIPDPTAEVGHCVHHIAAHPSRPGTLFMQKHWDVMRSDDAGDNWREISGDLPTDFGFAIDVHAHEPETLYVVPIKSDAEHFVPDGKLRVFRSRAGGNDWEPLTKGLPQQDCYVNVLRDAMAVDKLDDCGIYFGTSGGQVYASADSGDTWNAIVRDLPPVLSVPVRRCRQAQHGIIALRLPGGGGGPCLLQLCAPATYRRLMAGECLRVAGFGRLAWSAVITATGFFAMTVRNARAEASGVRRPPSQCLTASSEKPNVSENRACVLLQVLADALDVDFVGKSDPVAAPLPCEESIDFIKAGHQVMKHSGHGFPPYLAKISPARFASSLRSFFVRLSLSFFAYAATRKTGKLWSCRM